MVKSNLKNQEVLSFQSISKCDMEEKIKNTDFRKATTKSTILPKTFKISCNTSAKILLNLFNECPITDNFLDELKLTATTPVLKKKDPLKKENYRPASVLPSISKNFEKFMQKKIELALLSFTENGKKF